MLSIHVEPRARIRYSSHNSHHKLASRTSQLVSQGRKLRHREVGIGLSLSKGADCGFELTTLWFQSLCSFHYTLNSSPRGLLIVQESAFGFCLFLVRGRHHQIGAKSAVPQLGILISEYSFSVTCCTFVCPGCRL